MEQNSVPVSIVSANVSKPSRGWKLSPRSSVSLWLRHSFASCMLLVMKLDQYIGSMPDATHRKWNKHNIMPSIMTFSMLYHLCHLLMRGLGLKTISKPLTSRAQLSWSNEAHGTVREMAWMKPSVTSNGASTDSRISFRDCRNITQGHESNSFYVHNHNN